MGWASGSNVAYNIVKAIKVNVKDEKVREKLYVALINSFEDADCDTMYELVGIDPIYDKFFPEEDDVE